MTKLTLDISMSLDGFIAGPNQTLDEPLGRGGNRLHEWAVATRAFRERHGLEGGETGPESDLITEGVRNIGATIMGRRMFSGGEGRWEDDPNADAWWGDDPPFHHPVFVLTHLVPVLLGDGVRLFDGRLDTAPAALEPIATVESPRVTHLRYRVAG